MRQRQRFERTDVPKPSARLNLIGIAVLLVVAISASALVLSLWNKAKSDSKLGDAALSDALAAQTVEANFEGLEVSSDTITSYLIITTDDVRKETGATLKALQIMSYNSSQNKMVLVNVSIDQAIVGIGDNQTLADFYSAQGAEKLVSALSSAAQMKFEHMIATPKSIQELFDELRGLTTTKMLQKASSLLSTIRTDMNAQELLSLVEPYSQISRDQIVQVDMGFVPGGEEGAPSTINTQQLALDTGRFIQK